MNSTKPTPTLRKNCASCLGRTTDSAAQSPLGQQGRASGFGHSRFLSRLKWLVARAVGYAAADQAPVVPAPVPAPAAAAAAARTRDKTFLIKTAYEVYLTGQGYNKRQILQIFWDRAAAEEFVQPYNGEYRRAAVNRIHVIQIGQAWHRYYITPLHIKSKLSSEKINQSSNTSLV